MILRPALPSAQPSAAPTEALAHPAERREAVKSSINALVPQFAQLIPANADMNPRRFATVAINYLLGDPTGKLIQCTRASLMRGFLSAAEVGLELGGAHGHCYLVPYQQRDGSLIAQFQIGVRGYIELARRCPQIEDIWADVIYSEDEYEVTSGSAGKIIRHFPRWDLPVSERGRLLGAYACAKLANGAVSCELLNAEELNQARQTSSAPNSPAWKNWPTEMYKRTAIKRAQKYWPKSTELSTALRTESPVVSDIVVHPTGAPTSTSNEAIPVPQNDSPTAESRPVANSNAQPQDVSIIDVQQALSQIEPLWESDHTLAIISAWTPRQRIDAQSWAEEELERRMSGDSSLSELPRPPHTIVSREPGEEG